MAERRATRKKDNTTSQAVGAGVGLTGGAAAGAALGSLAGPVGTAVGALLGGAVGGFAGKEVADVIDPAEEDRYWEKEYASRPYIEPGTKYDEYRPAYRCGVEAVNRYHGEPFDDVERRLKRSWSRLRGCSSLSWGKAKGAVRDAYNRALQRHGERRRVVQDQAPTGDASSRTGRRRQ